MRKLSTYLAAAFALCLAACVALFYLLPAPPCFRPVYSAPEQVAVTPDGKFAYLSDSVAKRLLVFSLGDNRLAASVALTAPARELAISRDGRKVYLLSLGEDGGVAVVDTASNAVERHIEVTGKLRGLAIGADGKILYAVQGDVHKLIAFDVATGKIAASVLLDGDAVRIAAAPDGKSLVVAHGTGVTLFDAQTLQPKANYDMKEKIVGTALSPDGKVFAYSFSGQETGIRFLNLADGASEVRATLMSAAELAFAPDGVSVIAANASMPNETQGGLAVMPAHIPEEVKGAIVPSVPPDRSVSLALDKFPRALAFDAAHNRLDVVALSPQGVGAVEVLDGVSHKVLAQITLPDAKTAWDKLVAWRMSALHRDDAAHCKSVVN